MRLLAILVLAVALGGCHEQHETYDTNLAETSIRTPAANCYDCDGFEGFVFNETINAMQRASDACGGGPVELIENAQSAWNTSDYQCRQ